MNLIRTVWEVEDHRVWHAAWSPDGSYLAACGSNRACVLFRVDPKTGETRKVASLQDSHSRTVRCCEFAPERKDGRVFLATASFDATCVIWERKGGEYGPDAAEEEEWEAVATLDGHENEVKSVAWSHDGSFLATCGRDKTCWVWEMDETGEEWRCVSVLTGHEGDVKQVRFHPSRYMFASCSYDDTIRLWEYSEDEGDFLAVAVLKGHENTVWGCSFVNEDMLVSCSQDVTLRSWIRRHQSETEEYAADGDEQWELSFTTQHSVHSRTIFSLDITPDNWLVTGGGDNAIVIRKINPETGFILEGEKECIIQQNAHEQDVNCVRFRPRPKDSTTDGPVLLASTGDDGKLLLWSVDLSEKPLQATNEAE